MTNRRQAQVRRLQSAAIEYVETGWPIVPLRPTGDHVVTQMSPRDAIEAADWWSEQPYGIAIRVGEVFDVVEMQPSVGELVLVDLVRRLRAPVPVIKLPERGWLLPVTPGARPMPELVLYRRQARLHRRRSWLPLPPTPLVGGGEVAWISRGRVPHSLVVQTSTYLTLRRANAEQTTGLGQ